MAKSLESVHNYIDEPRQNVMVSCKAQIAAEDTPRAEEYRCSIVVLNLEFQKIGKC